MDLVKFAKVAGRFDEMADSMDLLQPPLTREARELLALAYTKSVEQRRQSIQNLQSVISEEEKGLAPFTNYVFKIESEISKICDKICSKIEAFRVTDAVDDDSKAFYGKMSKEFQTYKNDLKLQFGVFWESQVPKILDDTPEKVTRALYCEEMLAKLPGNIVMNLVNETTFHFKVHRYDFCLTVPKGYPAEGATIKCLSDVEMLGVIDENGFVMLEQGLTLLCALGEVFVTFSSLSSSEESEKDKDLFN